MVSQYVPRHNNAQPQARVRIPPPGDPSKLAVSQPDSPTGHWFQNTPTRLRDVDSILQRVSTLVAPSPIDPVDERRETVLPPALAAQFSPLGRSASLLPPVEVVITPDTLCGVHIPPRQLEEHDVTPFASASPSPRRGGALSAFGDEYRPVAAKAVQRVGRIFGVVIH